jgi:pimeloyl-ACP methyl ester carboxylesterase
VDSPALQGNRLRDPSVRPLFVWTPPSYDASGERRYPAVYVLHGMTSQARAWFNVAPFAENVPAAVERLGLEGIVALVDGWTALGGSQWVDSPAIGNYGTYLCEDVVGAVDAAYRTLPAPAHRGLVGHSSGGFGAALWALLRPDRFGGLASHAGDALFEVCFAPEFAAAAQVLRNEYGGSFEAFWQDFRSGRPPFSRSSDALLQNLFATAAAFSPRDDGSFELPFRVETGELAPEAWQRWLAWDPVRLAPGRIEAVRSLRAVWIDAGRRDEYRLDLAATALRDAFVRCGAGAVRFELFDGGHRGANWRLPLSLAYLLEQLS